MPEKRTTERALGQMEDSETISAPFTEMAEPTAAEPSSSASEPEGAAADPSGYQWDPRGYYWHPLARHWYEPYAGVYYTEGGEVLPAEQAQAELAEAMGWGAAPLPEEQESASAQDEPLPDPMDAPPALPDPDHEEAELHLGDDLGLPAFDSFQDTPTVVGDSEYEDLAALQSGAPEEEGPSFPDEEVEELTFADVGVPAPFLEAARQEALLEVSEASFPSFDEADDLPALDLPSIELAPDEETFELASASEFLDLAAVANAAPVDPAPEALAPIASGVAWDFDDPLPTSPPPLQAPPPERTLLEALEPQTSIDVDVAGDLFGDPADLSVDGWEPLEEAPSPEPAAPTERFQVTSPERAIVHLVDGQVRRGILQEGDLFLRLRLESSAGLETYDPRDVQIVFFLREPDDPPPPQEGLLIQVFLPMGRSLTGFAPPAASAERGFFLTPRGTGGTTSRVFLYPWSIQRMVAS